MKVFTAGSLAASCSWKCPFGTERAVNLTRPEKNIVHLTDWQPLSRKGAAFWPSLLHRDTLLNPCIILLYKKLHLGLSIYWCYSIRVKLYQSGAFLNVVIHTLWLYSPRFNRTQWDRGQLISANLKSVQWVASLVCWKSWLRVVRSGSAVVHLMNNVHSVISNLLRVDR